MAWRGDAEAAAPGDRFKRGLAAYLISRKVGGRVRGAEAARSLRRDPVLSGAGRVEASPRTWFLEKWERDDKGRE